MRTLAAAASADHAAVAEVEASSCHAATVAVEAAEASSGGMRRQAAPQDAAKVPQEQER